MAKTNTIDYRDGGLEFAKRIAIHLQSGKLTQAEFDYELNAWNAAQYEAVTQQQIDLKTAQQATAQLRELRKEQETILANDQKLIESHARLSAIYHPRPIVEMKSDAFDNQHMAGNFRNGF